MTDFIHSCISIGIRLCIAVVYRRRYFASFSFDDEGTCRFFRIKMRDILLVILGIIRWPYPETKSLAIRSSCMFDFLYLHPVIPFAACGTRTRYVYLEVIALLHGAFYLSSRLIDQLKCSR